MRYLVTLLCVLALLVALPQRVAAQTSAKATTSAASAVHVRHHLPRQLMLRASYYLYLDAALGTEATSDQTEPNADKPESAQADGGVATSESNREEPVLLPAPGSEVPDIDTLSARSIEHYESLEHHELFTADSGQRGGGRGAGKRSPGAKAGIAVGVILGVGLVGVAIGAAVVIPNFMSDFSLE
jgi:hypothetical protein